MLRRLILATLLAAGAAHAQLPEPVAALMQAKHIPPSAIGVVVLRGDTPLLTHNASASMLTGSTMKLVTAMVSLEQLGPVFRGRTEFRSEVPLVKGVLQGDLYLRGGADVDLNEDVLFHMLQALRNQGIETIQGDIVLDRELFRPARPDPNAPPFDEYPWAYYNVLPDALLINSNLLKLELRSSDNQLSLVMMPEMEKVAVSSDMKLTNAACSTWQNGWRAPDVVEQDGTLTVRLHGNFPNNCTGAISINALNRQDYLARLLRAKWARMGGKLTGAVRESNASPVTTPTPPTARLLAEHVSRSLPEVLRDMNKQSDNVLARTLFLSLGSLEADPVLGSHPITLASGETTAAHAEGVIRNWLRAHGIDDQGLVLENGAGLSRRERATPAQMAAVLQAGLRSQWMPEFLASLSIAATDGTMRHRLKDSPAAAHARMKTGTLNGVTANVGYVQDASGQQNVVVAIINHELATYANGTAILDALNDWVARYNPDATSSTR